MSVIRTLRGRVAISAVLAALAFALYLGMRYGLVDVVRRGPARMSAGQASR